MHTAFSQSTCAVLPACFWRLRRLVTTSWLLLPLPKHPLKHQGWRTTQDGPSCRRICFEKVTMKHIGFCYPLLFNHKLHHFSTTEFMCRKNKASPHFETVILVCFIYSLNVDYMLGHCNRQTTNCPTGLPSLYQGQGAIPYPAPLAPFLTDHYSSVLIQCLCWQRFPSSNGPSLSQYFSWPISGILFLLSILNNPYWF